MIVVESRQGRRLVGRLDRGVDLFGAILGVCREHGVTTAEIRGIGSLENAELAGFDQESKQWKPARKLEGGFEIVNLSGNVSDKDGQLAVHCHVTLMRDGADGIRVYAGHVVSARVFALEFVVDAFDDVILHRAADPATGLSQWRDGQSVMPAAAAPAPSERPPVRPSRPVPVAPPTAPTLVPQPQTYASAGAGSSWAEVAAASAKAAGIVEEEMEPLADDEDPVRVGDVIEHPKFGKGEVQRVEGADEFIHIRIPSGRLIRLSLDVLRLSVKSRDGKKRVFKAKIE